MNILRESSWSRRSFLQRAAVAGGAALLPANVEAETAKPHKKISSQEALKFEPAQPFPMTAVRLLPGPWLDMMKTNAAFLLSIPNERLLHNFLIKAGLPSTAQPLGGWESPNVELRGHYVGHYLSACALLYAATGDAEVRTKVTALVDGIAKTQESDGYLGAYPRTLYDRLRNFERVWAPFYTYHKLLAGLIDVYELCADPQALTVATRAADWAAAWIEPIAPDEFQKILVEEHGGMAESFLNLYAITSNPRYLAAARRFEHHEILDPLAANQDRLAGNHANTNIPKIIGAARAYEITHEDRYRHISQNFYRIVVDHHSYCTGGTSDEEYWFEPDAVSTRLGPKAQECCCSYNMLKLTRKLFSWNADPAYFDYYERVLYNMRSGTQQPDGTLMYFVSMASGLYRTFGSQFGSFWCCTGTGSEEFAKLNDSIYFHGEDSVYVNLFIPSSLNSAAQGISLEMTTRFPEENKVRLHVRSAPSNPMAIKIRIPGYVDGATAVINGERQPVSAQAGSWLSLRRTWKAEDVVEVTLPLTVRTERAPDNPEVQSAFYGPLSLALLMGTDLLTPKMQQGVQGPDVQGRPHPLPRISASGVWLRQVEGSPETPLRFRSAGDTPYTLIPFNQVRDQRYSLYARVLKT